MRKQYRESDRYRIVSSYGKLRERIRVKGFTAVCAIAALSMLFLVTPVASAGEFFAGGGIADDTESGNANSQTGWYVAYYEPLCDWSMFSLTYLNEGHQPDHKRDGFAPQVWARTPVFADLRLGVGIGPYIFFDTKSTDDEIDHGVGIMSSGIITWYHLQPLLFQVRLDYIQAFNNYNGFSGAFAIGFLLNDAKTSLSGNALPPARNEIALYAGQTVMNNDHSKATALSVEYRRKLFRYLDWSIGFLHEGDSRPVGRYGVLSQLWLAKEFHDNRLMLGFGAGPYLAHDRDGEETKDRDILAGAISVTAAWRVTSHLGIRGTFHRIMTDRNRDSDVFMAGLAISF